MSTIGESADDFTADSQKQTEHQRVLSSGSASGSLRSQPAHWVGEDSAVRRDGGRTSLELEGIVALIPDAREPMCDPTRDPMCDQTCDPT
jgi:hypothetical protein